MTHGKRLLCLLLSCAMLMSNTAVVFADDGTKVPEGNLTNTVTDEGLDDPGTGDTKTVKYPKQAYNPGNPYQRSAGFTFYTDYPVNGGKKGAVAIFTEPFTVNGVRFSATGTDYQAASDVTGYTKNDSYSYMSATYQAVQITDPQAGNYLIWVEPSDGISPDGSGSFLALLKYTSADEEAPTITFTRMEFTSGDSDPKLKFVIGASDTSGIQSLEYATSPLSSPTTMSTAWTTTSTGSELTVPYLSNGMILWGRATDTVGNTKTTPVLVVNPTTEGEKIITPSVTSNKDADGVVTSVTVQFAYDPTTYASATGTNISFAKASLADPLAKDIIVENLQNPYLVEENGEWTFHIDLPMTKTVNVDGKSTQLMTTIHYKLKVPITAIGTQETPVTPPTVVVTPIPGDDNTGPSVEISTPSSDATLYYKWVDSDKVGNVGETGFTSAGAGPATVTVPSLVTKAKVLVAYAEKSGVKSKLGVALFVDDDQMLELEPSPAKEVWVKEERDIKVKVANGGQYANQYVTNSKLNYAAAPDYIVSGDNNTYNTGTNPEYSVTANKMYSFGVSDIARVTVVNPFDTTASYEAADNFAVTKDYTENRIDFNAPIIPEISTINPGATGTTVDLTGITDTESGIKTSGYYVDAESAFVAPSGTAAWDTSKYPITAGNPVIGPFDKGQLVVYAEDNVGRFSYKVVTIEGMSLPEISDAKDPSGWTNNDVDVTVTIKPQAGDLTENWSVKDGTHIIKQPNGDGTFVIHFTDNGSKDIVIVGPGNYEVTYPVVVSNIDKIAPTFDSVTKNTEDATNGDVTLTIRVSDNVGGSGLNDFTAAEPAEITKKDMNTGDVTVTIPENVTDLELKVSDKAGNETTNKITIDNIDKGNPTITVTPDKTTWTNQDVNLAIEFADDKGVTNVVVDETFSGYVNDSVTVTVDDYSSGTGTGVVSQNTAIRVQAQDAAGNKASADLTIDYIDKVKPEVKIVSSGISNGFHQLRITATDDASQVKSTTFALVADLQDATIAAANWRAATNILSTKYSDATKYVLARAEDNAGNVSEIVKYNLADFSKYVTVTQDPTDWTPGTVNVQVNVDWARYNDDFGLTDASGTMGDAKGKTFGTYTPSGSTVVTYVLDHNDQYSITIRDIPDGKGGTFNHEIDVSVDNIDVLAPVLSNTRAGHYDDKQTWVIVTAQDIPSVTDLPYTDVSGVEQAVVMLTANVPDGNYYSGVLSGNPVTLDSEHKAFIGFSSLDLQEYSLVVKDKAGNLAKVPLDTNRITGGPQVSLSTETWTKEDVVLTIDATNPDPGHLNAALYLDGKIIEDIPTTQRVTQNGEYEVSSLYGWQEFAPNYVIPNNPMSGTNASRFEPDITAITQLDMSGRALVAEHNIGTYDWKLPTKKIVNNIDKTAPNIVVTDDATGGVASKEVTVTVKATDPVNNQTYPDASGINTIQYKVGDNPPVTVNGSQTSFVINSNVTTTITVEDLAGNVATTTYTSSIDSEAPKMTYTTNPAAGSWTSSICYVDMDVTDNLSGIKTVMYPSDLKLKELPSTADKMHHTYKFFAEKNGTFNITLTDNAGNSAVVPLVVANIDKIGPTINASTSPAGTTYGEVTISLDVFDTESGLKNLQCPDGSVLAPEDGKVTYKVPSNGNYEFVAEDNAGNITRKQVTVNNIKVEISRPQDSKYETVNETSNVYTRIVLDWTNSKQTISPQAYPTDQIEKYEYAVTKINDEDDTVKNPSWKTSRTKPSIKMEREGVFSVQVRAYNKAGTVSEITEYIVQQDFTKPRITKESVTNSYIKFTAKDNLSGIDYVECDCGNSSDEDGYIKCSKSDGKTHKYTIVDLAGNKLTETIKIGDKSYSNDDDDDDDDDDDESSTSDRVVSNKNTNTDEPSTSGKSNGAANPPTGK